jgi:hypothetical protein
MPSILFSLLIGIFGWYYLFYSRAAHRLSTIEADALNIRRIRLRRINGGAMMVLAALYYIGTRAIDAHERPRTFITVWIGVACTLLIVVILALIDLRLTTRLRMRKDEDRS